MKRCSCFRADETGASAVEFAMIVPIVVILIVGVINVCVLYMSQSAMDWATEAGARHWAVNTTLAAGASTVTGSAAAWAKSSYGGPGLTALTFTGTTASTSSVTGQCTTGNTTGAPGYVMSATATYNFSAVFTQIPISLSSTACYPEIQ